MTSSRTGSGKYRRNRALVLATAQRNGLTHCPGWTDHTGTHHNCGTELNYNEPLQPNSAETDHITPHHYGGTDNRENLTVICRTCNNQKGDGTKTPTPQARTHHYPTSRAW